MEIFMTRVSLLCVLISFFYGELFSQKMTYSIAEQEEFRNTRNEYLVATALHKDIAKVKDAIDRLNAILKKYPNTLNKKAIITTLFDAKIWLSVNGNMILPSINVTERNAENDSNALEIAALGKEILSDSPQHFDYNTVAEGLLKRNIYLHSATEYSLESIRLLSDSGNLHMPEYYFVLGELYKNQHLYDSAVRAFLSADRIIDKISEKQYKFAHRQLFVKVRNLIELADTYQRINKIEKSIAIYKYLYEQNIYSDNIRDSFKRVLVKEGKTESEADDELRKMKIYFLESAKEKIWNAPLGKSAPDFSLTNYKNENIKLSNYRNKIIILNFWAGWCYPCFVEMPLLAELKNKYPSAEFDIIALNADYEFQGGYEKVIHDYNINYEILNSTPQVNELYDVPPLPLTLIIDKNGYIRFRHKGYFGTMKDQIEMEVERLIKKSN